MLFWLLLPGLCLCPFLRAEKQTLAKYLPAISGASARQPAAHKGRVLCVFVHVCVRECCAWQSVRLPGCSQAVSEARSASTARVLVCVHGRTLLCVRAPALRWVMTQRKDSEHTVLNSTEGPRDKYNSAQRSFLCRPLLQSFHHLFSPAFYLCPSFSYCSLYPCVCVPACMRVCSSLPNKGMVLAMYTAVTLPHNTG